MPDLGAFSGIVTITAHGPTANYCKVVNLGRSRTFGLVNTGCFTVSGVVADTPFTPSCTNLARFSYDFAYEMSDSTPETPVGTVQDPRLEEGSPCLVQSRS